MPAFVVFYRNLNLGHANCPTREQLEDALREAGAVRVRSIRSNGTVLIEAPDPESVVREAAQFLEQVSGYHDAAFVRPFELLTSILTADPFAGRSEETTYRETFTFFGDGTPLALDLPWTNDRGDVEIFRVTNGIALGVIWRTRSGPGSPAAEIERLTGGRATTRTRETIELLVAEGRKW